MTFQWLTTNKIPFDQLIIRGATLINGNGAPPSGPVDIVIENNIIKSVRNVDENPTIRLFLR